MAEPSSPLPWKRVAVTGTAGNIGAATARRLHELGYSLVLLDKLPSVDLPHPTVTTDLRDSEAVLKALEGVDAVVHIGEVPNILPGMTGEQVFETNTAICRTMLAAGKKQGVQRFIYTSSCQVYGYWGTNRYLTEHVAEVWPLDERQPTHPMNGYAESKVANERQGAEAAGDMQVLIYRFPWVHPIRGGERTQRHWIRADEQLFEGFWTYLAIEDAAEAYVKGLNPSGREASRLGTCETFHFVADEVAGAMPIREKMKRFLPAWPTLPDDWGTRVPPVACEKADRLLGWRSTARMSAVIEPTGKQTER